MNTPIQQMGPNLFISNLVLIPGISGAGEIGRKGEIYPEYIYSLFRIRDPVKIHRLDSIKILTESVELQFEFKEKDIS